MKDYRANYLGRLGQEIAVMRRTLFGWLRRDSVKGARVYRIPDLLPREVFEELLVIAREQRGTFFRKNSAMRSGAALSSEELRKGPWNLLADHLISDHVLNRVRDVLEIPGLEFVNMEDTNQLSLLFYGEPGDGIGWHFDGNIYLGERWAGIYTLQEDTKDDASKLEMRQDGKVKNFPASEMANSLALFQGDKVRHRVRPMRSGEERIVINVLFSTNSIPSRNPILMAYQTMVNYLFYGKAKT